jgi:hypothetical protein
MRIAIVSMPRERKGIPEYVKALARGMESMGHRVDMVDAWTEDGMRLPGYEYITVVAESVSFFSGKIPEALSRVLGTGSGMVGKKSAAFVKKGSFFMGRTLSNLMKAMEKEGMMVNWSDVLLNPAHAEAMGKRVGA